MGCLRACWCAGRQYRWRAGPASASLSVGLKRLIYSLKYRTTQPGQSTVCAGAAGVGKGSCSGEVGVALVRVSRGPPGLWPLPSPPPRHNISRSPFYRYLSFRGCQKPLPQCTEGSRQGGISTSAWVTDCRLGVGSSGGVEEWKSDWLLHMLRSGSGH